MKIKWGAIAYVAANFNIPDAVSEDKLEMYGTKGSIVASGTISQVEGGELDVRVCTDKSSVNDAGRDSAEVRHMEVNAEFGNMYTKQIEAFGKAVAGECEIPITVSDAVKSQKIVEAAYESSFGHDCK